MSDSSESLRAVGELIGTTFDISSYAIERTVEVAMLDLESWPDGKDDASSFIAARLTEGLRDVRRYGVAAELFELMVKHPEDQHEVFAYYLERDPQIN